MAKGHRRSRRTVLRAHPSSPAIRFEPQPNAFNRSIADTSGTCIISLRWSPTGSNRRVLCQQKPLLSEGGRIASI